MTSCKNLAPQEYGHREWDMTILQPIFHHTPERMEQYKLSLSYTTVMAIYQL